MLGSVSAQQHKYSRVRVLLYSSSSSRCKLTTAVDKTLLTRTRTYPVVLALLSIITPNAQGPLGCTRDYSQLDAKHYLLFCFDARPGVYGDGIFIAKILQQCHFIAFWAICIVNYAESAIRSSKTVAALIGSVQVANLSDDLYCTLGIFRRNWIPNFARFARKLTILENLGPAVCFSGKIAPKCCESSSDGNFQAT